MNDRMVQIGSLLWGGVDMTLAPSDPSPFPMLLNRLFEANIPYRISFLIESGGAETIAVKNSIATFLAITNPINKTIKKSMESLKASWLARRSYFRVDASS